MKKNVRNIYISLIAISLLLFTGCKNDDSTQGDVSQIENVSDSFIANQRAELANSLTGNEGSQSPRDIDSLTGNNTKVTVTAEPFTNMNLCDIHFHKGTEHKGGEFTKYAGNGNGEGYGTGYEYNYSDQLTPEELAPYTFKEQSEHNPLYPGDTIEVHYVYSDNEEAYLGNGLGTCFGNVAEGTQPSLRVEAEVYVLVNDNTAQDFNILNKITTEANGFHQAANIPDPSGTTAVHYEGSTTGPGYDETVSPYQVSWTVHTHVTKVNIGTVETWLEHNDFNETHAHGVRNLVLNPELLSPIN